jgi:hypothetical protein
MIGRRARWTFFLILAEEPLFEPLANIAYFQGFSLEGGTLTWPNWADIAPERLYEMVVNTNQAVLQT